MARKKLSELSMSELQYKVKQFKYVQYVILALAILYAIFMFYQMFTKTFAINIPQIVVPMVIVFASAALRKQQKEIQAEIENRQST